MSAKIETAPRPSKKVSPYKHTWVRDDNGLLGLVFGENVMFIWEENGVWISTATLDGKKYRAERATLEDAAKAADRLLYKKFPHVWTVTDARGIIAPWKGDLCL
jgi:hypothetical protein